MFSRGIADGLVLEVVAHPLRRLLQLAQVSDSGLLELCLASCRGGARRVTPSLRSAFKHSSGFSSGL